MNSITNGLGQEINGNQADKSLTHCKYQKFLTAMMPPSEGFKIASTTGEAKVQLHGFHVSGGYTCISLGKAIILAPLKTAWQTAYEFIKSISDQQTARRGFYIKGYKL
jgi:hypothetical protein